MQTQAIELNQKNFNVILNRTDIPIEDLTAMNEHRKSLYQHSYIVVEYKDKNGTYHPWVEMAEDYFLDNYRWTEAPRTGFRYCKLK